MKKQKIINYTTSVPVEKTLADIERLLSRFGVTKSMRDYAADGRVVGYYFSLNVNGAPMLFKLPCNSEKVFAVLIHGYKKKRRDTEKKVKEQSDKIAWRVLYSSLAADLTRIELQQVKAEQVFMPHAYNSRLGKTYFEMAEQDGFKQLSA